MLELEELGVPRKARPNLLGLIAPVIGDEPRQSALWMSERLALVGRLEFAYFRGSAHGQTWGASERDGPVQKECSSKSAQHSIGRRAPFIGLRAGSSSSSDMGQVRSKAKTAYRARSRSS